MLPRTFRATSTAVSFWVIVAFGAFLIGDSVIRGAWSTVVAYLPPVLLVLWAFWVFLWRTNVRALPDRAIVTNLLRVHHVPWSRVAGIRQSAQVVLELDAGAQVTAWGGPFPQRPGVPRRRAAVPSPTSSRPQVSFAATLEEYRRSAPDLPDPVRHRMDVVALTIGVVLGLATLARFLLL